MITRVTLGIVFLLLAAEEFLRTGAAAAEVVRRPGQHRVHQLAGPWLLLAYGLLMLVRAVADRKA